MQSFRDLFFETKTLRESDQHGQALALLKAHESTFPDERHWNLYVQSLIHASLRRDDEAISVLQSAFERGYWYNPEFHLHAEIEELAHLVQHAGFKDLIALAHQRMSEAEEHSDPHLEIFHPTDGPSKNIFIALHGNNSSGKLTLPYWKPLLEMGWTLAVPTSSQVMNYQAYKWNDFAIAERELAQHFDQLSGDVFVVGGFSRGAYAGMRAALTGALPVRGFVALAAVLHDIDNMLTLVKTRPPHLRGFIVMGENDQYGVEKPQQFAEAFGPACHLELREGLGHEFPPDMKDTLQRAINHIVK